MLMTLCYTCDFQHSAVTKCCICDIQHDVVTDCYMCDFQHDAVTNLRKAKSLYISRQQEYDKLKEQTVKSDSESHSVAAGGNAAVVKSERKKKQEDDALQKVCTAC